MMRLVVEGENKQECRSLIDSMIRMTMMINISMPQRTLITLATSSWYFGSQKIDVTRKMVMIIELTAMDDQRP